MKKILFIICLIPLLSFSQVGINNNVYHVGDSAWTDITVPATTIRQGASTKPDFNTDSLTLDFPQNNESEIAYLNVQFGHDWLTGSDISPHIHYLQNEAGSPDFIIEYRWLSNGNAVTDWTTDTTYMSVFPYTSGSIMQILEFPKIDGSAITGVSSMLQIKLYRRTGDGVSGDVQVLEFDIHIQIDSNGSDSEYLKSWD